MLLVELSELSLEIPMEDLVGIVHNEISWWVSNVAPSSDMATPGRLSISDLCQVRAFTSISGACQSETLVRPSHGALMWPVVSPTVGT